MFPSLIMFSIAYLNILIFRYMLWLTCRMVIIYCRAGSRNGSRTAATSKIECFVIIANGWKSLTIITKRSILEVAAVLDPPLDRSNIYVMTQSRVMF